jgi:rhodanese-related sulfurtransferase
MPAEVDRNELWRMVESGAQLVEVLPEEEYAEDHLPKEISLTLRRLDDEASTTLDRNRPVIVYCWDTA